MSRFLLPVLLAALPSAPAGTQGGLPPPFCGGPQATVTHRSGVMPHDFLLGFPWGRTRADDRRSKKPFPVDEFKIRKTAKTEFAR